MRSSSGTTALRRPSKNDLAPGGRQIRLVLIEQRVIPFRLPAQVIGSLAAQSHQLAQIRREQGEIVLGPCLLPDRVGLCCQLRAPPHQIRRQLGRLIVGAAPLAQVGGLRGQALPLLRRGQQLADARIGGFAVHLLRQV